MRLARLLAYVLVVCLAAYSVGTVRSDQRRDTARSAEQRAAIAQAGINAVRFGCARDRRTIGELRVILIRSKRNTALLLKEKTITSGQYRRGINEADRALSRLPLPDCDQIVKSYTDSVSPGA
jgi:hypothetical protein